VLSLDYSPVVLFFLRIKRIVDTQTLKVRVRLAGISSLRNQFLATGVEGGAASESWMRNAYMSLAMSLAISLVTLWLKDGQTE
jgi:hypothetical protein